MNKLQEIYNYLKQQNESEQILVNFPLVKDPDNQSEYIEAINIVTEKLGKKLLQAQQEK